MVEFTPVEEFKFMAPFVENLNNGLYFNRFYLPIEITEHILSYLPPKNLLPITLVCKKWCNIIKSQTFWMGIYNRQYPYEAQKLPWFVFYSYFATNNFHNLLKDNGKDTEVIGYVHCGNHYGIQYPLQNTVRGIRSGQEEAVPEISFGNNDPSHDSDLEVVISLNNKRLLRYILKKFAPAIYASEQVSGRYDCECFYKVALRAYEIDCVEEMNIFSTQALLAFMSLPCVSITKVKVIHAEEARIWDKVEILFQAHTQNLKSLILHHGSINLCKIADRVVKVVFESIQPVEEKRETRVGI